MKQNMELTARDILALSRADLERIFPGGPAAIRQGLSKLLSRWHPDICKDARAGEVTSHIVSLRRSLDGKEAVPDSGLTRVIRTRDGRRLRMRPLSVRKVDTGEILVGKRVLAHVFPVEIADLAHREAGTIRGFRFADPGMKRQMAPFLPRLVEEKDLEDGARMVLTERSGGEVLLADLLEKSGPLPPVHAAWLCSGLMNIAAWMEYAGLVHGAIGPEYILVDPETHSVRLSGGWGFAVEPGKRPPALPWRTTDLIPRLSMGGVGMDHAVDLELVRQTVRDALGDPRGTGSAVRDLPPAIHAWLALPPSAGAARDYAAWQSALERDWGKRRFVEFPVRAADIYLPSR